jgi:hypothetical protein
MKKILFSLMTGIIFTFGLLIPTAAQANSSIRPHITGGDVIVLNTHEASNLVICWDNVNKDALRIQGFTDGIQCNNTSGHQISDFELVNYKVFSVGGTNYGAYQLEALNSSGNLTGSCTDYNGSGNTNYVMLACNTNTVAEYNWFDPFGGNYFNIFDMYNFTSNVLDDIAMTAVASTGSVVFGTTSIEDTQEWYATIS